MSQTGSRPSGDESVISLTFEFQGLSIQVTGPSLQVAGFVRELVDTRRPATTESHHDAESAAPSRASSTRHSVEQDFPACPPEILALATRLSGSSSATLPADRIRRAFRAGQWAAATRAGQVATPN